MFSSQILYQSLEIVHFGSDYWKFTDFTEITEKYQFFHCNAVPFGVFAGNIIQVN